LQQQNSKNVASVVDYLSDEQAANLLGVSSGTIKRWRLEGRLGFLRIGPRRVAIRPEDVTAFIEGGMQPAKAA
jgi:excisionase family DNA binding protein